MGCRTCHSSLVVAGWESKFCCHLSSIDWEIQSAIHDSSLSQAYLEAGIVEWILLWKFSHKCRPKSPSIWDWNDNKQWQDPAYSSWVIVVVFLVFLLFGWVQPLSLLYIQPVILWIHKEQMQKTIEYWEIHPCSWEEMCALPWHEAEQPQPHKDDFDERNNSRILFSTCSVRIW